MRDRYQKIEKRSQTLPKRDTGFKKDAYKEGGWNSRYGETMQKKKSKVSKRVSSSKKPISMLRFFVGQNREAQKTLKLWGLLILGVVAVITLDNGWGEIVDTGIAIMFVALAVTPVILLMIFLNKFLPEKAVVWIGALLIIAMALSFVFYVLSNWGGGY